MILEEKYDQEYLVFYSVDESQVPLQNKDKLLTATITLLAHRTN